MKLSGAIKSVIHGVTTNNLVSSASVFWKRMDNVMTREDEGLTKRPPLEHVTDLGLTLGTGEFVKKFIIHDVAYFLIVRKSPLTMSVVREDGNTYTVTDQLEGDDTYFETVTEEQLKIAVHGELVFLLNNGKTVAMTPQSDAFANNSLLYIKAPMEQGEVVYVTARNEFGAKVTKNITVASTLMGTAPDTVAGQISTAFNADASFTCATKGAVVQFVRVDGEFCEVTVKTSFNIEDRIIVLNGEVESFTDLPQYSFYNNRQMVKPKNQKDGDPVYMKAIGESDTDSEEALADPTLVWPTALWSDVKFSWYVESGLPYPNNWEKVPAYGLPDDPTKNYKLIYYPADEGETRMLGTAEMNYILLGMLYDDPTADPSDPIDWETQWSDFFLINWVYIWGVQSAPGLNGDVYTTRIALAADPQTELVYSDNMVSNGTVQWYDSTYTGMPVLDAGVLYDVWPDQNGSYPAVSTELIQVKWVETAAPYSEIDIDRQTMPHVLQPLSANEFTLQAANWDDKRAGDLTTNPLPRFVGETIEDIAIFQNRLACLTNDEVVMSATNNVFHFFRDTVTQLLSKHPVNIRSTSAQSSKLHFFVYHNRDLLVTAGRQQYKISGDAPITPQTASMQLTTSYNSSETVEPVSIGNSVYLPNHHGVYLNLNKYSGSNQNLTPDSADNITKHVRTYIDGTVNVLDGLPNHGLLFAASTSGEDLFVCNYDTEESRIEDKRYAWFKWNDMADVAYKIKAIAATKNKLSVVIDIPTTGLQLLEFDLDAGAAKKYMDFQKTFTSVNTTVDVGTTYGVAEANIKVVQGTGCPEPGDYVGITSLVAGVITLDTDMAGGTVYVGREYDVYAEPNLLTVRDEGGAINRASNLRIQKFWISLVDTGILDATEQSPYDTYDTQEFFGVVSNSLDAITDTAVTTEDTFKVGFKQKADVGTLLIHTKSWLPMTISQVDWFGNYTSRGRRR